MTFKSRTLWFFALVAIACLSLFPATARAADDSKNLTVLSRKVVKPLITMDLRQHFAPVHERIGPPGMQSLGNNKTRMIYWTKIELADGTLMTVTKSYDVTKTRDNSNEGRFANLSVYDVHPAGQANSIITVGLSPSDDVVVLNGASLEGVPGLVPRH